MKVFDGLKLMNLFSLLEKTVLLSQKDDPNRVISERVTYLMVDKVKELKQLCEELGLSTAAVKAARVIDDIKPDLKAGSLSAPFESLTEIITLEMRAHLFMYVEPSKAPYYSDSDLFGDRVAERFPLAKDDIEEAGKCLALNRGTACVFHLMRVLEAGLYAVAGALEIQDIEPNWHNAIEQTEKQIRSLPSKTPEEKSELTFYSDAAAYLFAVKEPWRNRSAHAGKTYTEEKAQQIFESVRGFMQTLSTKLTEKPL